MITPEQQKKDDITAAILALGVVFISRLPATLASIQLELACITQENNKEEAWQTLYRLLHTLAGSSGMFGYPELGNSARAIENRIKPILKGNQADATALIADLHDFMSWITIHYITAPSTAPQT